MFVGNVGEKITVNVIYNKRFSYPKYFGYNTNEYYIHLFSDSDNNVFVWNTMSFVSDKDFIDEVHGVCEVIPYGSSLQMTATVKEHKVYNETEQTVISRPKFKVIALGETVEQRNNRRFEEQMQTIKDCDFIWTMPYRQYKEHYSDCETVVNSYCKETSEIGVIIRCGRLKNSGVRGKHFHGFQMSAPDGKYMVFRAVSEENATKQLLKLYPNATNWKCTKIYM